MASAALLANRRRKTTTFSHYGQVKGKPRDLQERILSPTRRHNPQPPGLVYQSPLHSNAQVNHYACSLRTPEIRILGIDGNLVFWNQFRFCNDWNCIKLFLVSIAAHGANERNTTQKIVSRLGILCILLCRKPGERRIN